MPMVSTTSAWSPAASRRRTSFGGSEAPHIDVKRWICFRDRTGMMPGTIGTAIPAERQRSTKRQ